ncbi:MAG: Acetyltransferase (GNAT) family protein [Methanosaeta sp. PtaU1.Bin112]|nr:MAG: Acetyltransferase (GNAT) family protein [Methanosaeta sp. PtaU1.Bin112]
MSIEGYAIRNANRDEVDLIISWADQEGWNPGLNDAEAFYGTDPNGFFLGILDGLPVASISAVAYNNSFGFLGFYIVEPSLRGRGLGTGVWNAGMKYLGDRNIGLDGVLAQQKLYERLGFRLCYRSVRQQGSGTGLESKTEGIKYLSEVPLDDLLAYDDRFFPVPRHVFANLWIRQTGGIALAAVSNGGLAGYGLLRQCHIGYKIGPLFADDEDAAESLYRALCGHAPQGAPVFLDTPAVNPAALELARRHRMNPVFETVRMYNKGDPHLPVAQIYGVTSFELG